MYQWNQWNKAILFNFVIGKKIMDIIIIINHWIIEMNNIYLNLISSFCNRERKCMLGALHILLVNQFCYTFIQLFLVSVH